jgi:hypothetical protein
VYLFFRGTETKEGIISKEFNLESKYISHVGLGIFIDGNLKIFHVINSNKENHLECSSLYNFFDKKKEVTYTAIWKVEDLTDSNLLELTEVINSFKKKKIRFDLTFSGKDDNKLYCSEFVVEVLNKIDPIKFKFDKSKRKLNGFQSKFLRKDSLEYYPADVFLNNQNFLKIHESFRD